jgi:hypothetical protein
MAAPLPGAVFTLPIQPLRFLAMIVPTIARSAVLQGRRSERAALSPDILPQDRNPRARSRKAAQQPRCGAALPHGPQSGDSREFLL